MTNLHPRAFLPLLLASLFLLITTLGPGFDTALAESDNEAAAWNDEEICGALQEALQQPEYRNLRREIGGSELELGWLDRLLERLFGEGSSKDRPPPNSAMNLPDLSTVVIVLVVLIVIFALVAWARARSPEAAIPTLPEGSPGDIALETHAPGDFLMQEWMERARTLAASGNYAAAIRCLLFGGMSWTEEQGLVRHRPGLSNHSYVFALRTQPTQRKAFRKIVDSFERVYFGHREASAELFTGCLDTFRKGFLHGDRPQQTTDR